MASNPTTYAILISDIDPWPIPTTLKRKLQEVQLQDGIKERNIACSISMSFYHVRSKRFFGSTFVGYEHVFSITDSTHVSFPARNLNEMMYFQSKIQDRNCFAVLELVMTTYDSFNGSVASRYGCGWALLKPFLPTYGTKGNSQLDGIISTGKINVYAGTPKDLLSMKGDGAAVLKQLTNKKVDQPVSIVSYKIWRQDALNEIITSSNIVRIFHFSLTQH